MPKQSKTTTKKAGTIKVGKKIIKTKPEARTKQAILITLLEGPAGATIEEMMRVTGWQNHSVRGVLSGVLKKKLGLSVSSTQEERGRIYRIGA